MEEKLDALALFAEEIKGEGFTHVVLLGMDGSSLAPEVFQKTFGKSPGYPELIVLDSTHPEAVSALAGKLNFQNTLFLVSSKSGTTLETLSLFRVFWKKASEESPNPGRHFAAITDPGTPLEKLARERKFRSVFLAPSDVGGRFSALSEFGLLPAALIGVDIRRLLDRARLAAQENASGAPEKGSSALELAAALGEIGKLRDKLTLFTSPSLGSFPEWLEQLIAESTAKNGRGILPIAREPLVPLEFYGQDRLFCALTLAGDDCRQIDKRIKALEMAGHPVISIRLEDPIELGGEMFRWEVAVAAAGSILAIHPFNQPDVQLAKDFTGKSLEKIKASGGKYSAEGFSLADENKVSGALKGWISQASKGDYVAILAYLDPHPEIKQAVEALRLEITRHTQLPVTLGFGPRYLHSTGQLHKGGPNKGLFLQLVDEPEKDVEVPETDYTLGILIQAQSLGDFQALKERGRRILRLNLGKDAYRGLNRLRELWQT
jgi:transaldolase/glucose-6-phosphate isomerase